MGWNREKERRAGRNLSIAGCIFGLVFSIFWCIMATMIGAGFMLVFGIPFACLMGYRLVMCLKLTKENKHPQAPREPWEQPEPSREPQQPRFPSGAGGYCPYCGQQVDESFSFCPHCGRRIAG